MDPPRDGNILYAPCTPGSHRPGLMIYLALANVSQLNLEGKREFAYLGIEKGNTKEYYCFYIIDVEIIQT